MAFTTIPDTATADVPTWTNQALAQVDANAANALAQAATASAAASTAQVTANSALRHRGELPNGTDLNNLRGTANNGVWTIKNTTAAATIINLPPELLNTASEITTFTGTNGICHMSAEGYGTSFIELKRATANLAGTAWTTWRKPDMDLKPVVDSHTTQLAAHAAQLSGLDSNALRAMMMQQRFVKQHAGGYGTNGKIAVAFRFDHDLNAFGAKVLPLLQAKGWPASLAIMSGMFTTYSGYAKNTNYTWSDLQAWCLNYGIELWNHGANHIDAQTTAELDAEIVAPLAFYKTQLPKCFIPGYMIPGITQITAGYTVALGGFGNGNTLEAYDTAGGRRILSNHPVTMGYLPGSAYRVLDGTLAQGLGHTTIDGFTSASDAITIIENAKSYGTGVCFMLHASLLDTEGNMPTSVLAEIFDYVAAEEAAGTLEVLTVSGLTLANISKSRNFNMLVNGDFANMTGWAGQAGWTATAGGLAGSVAAGMLSRTMSISGLAWAYGATWRLSAEVTTGPAPVTIQLTVEDSANPANVSTTRTVEIPANTTRRVGVPVTLPTTGTTGLRFKIGRTAGGAVTKLAAARFEAI